MILTYINLASVAKVTARSTKKIHNPSRLSLVFFCSFVLSTVVVVCTTLVVLANVVVVTETDVVVVLAESHGGVTSVLMTTGDTRASLR
jgi:hypothetical protein